MALEAASSIIAAYNAGREPERLALKLAAMRGSVFSFFRGTAHLFWQRVAEANVDAHAPTAWCSGDLHLENFGTYLADNGLIYFDINDFDEAAKAPYDWEILRLLASIAVAQPELGLGKSDATALMTAAADAYIEALRDGTMRWIERRLAKGAIGDLMGDIKTRDQARLLDRRTKKSKGRRVLDVPSSRALPVADGERAKLAAFVAELGKRRGQDDYFTFIDAARRIAGTGSLGVARYVLLVEGDGSPDGNVLIDLKGAIPSSLAAVAKVEQPRWPAEGARIADTQHRCQAAAPHLLDAVTFDGGSFVIRELQPSADRLDLARIAGEKGGLADVVTTMARLAAWLQLRASGRGGAAPADDVMAFAQADKKLTDSWIATARALVTVTLADYQDYCHDYDAKVPAKP